ADGTGAQQPHAADDEHASLAFNRTQSAGGLGHGFGALRPLHAAAPPGRVQASDYAPAAGDAAAFPQTVTFSPVVRPRRGSAGSVASLE
ncbi:hypothetical protein NL520_27510, partial [Klebsiella pneumoniae]|nr:hypothetical protein [Klebsiella pneumoniae]